MSYSTAIFAPSPLLTDDPASSDGGIPSLEERMRGAIAQQTALSAREKEALVAMSGQIDASNPAQLLSLQEQVGNYALRTQFSAALVHKTVTGIETVIKSQ